ncbi:MAG: hypothetical protein ABFR75_07860 [Acidobacteriota bacterium]
MIEKINSYFSQLEGIITSPGPTLGGIMKSKNWVPVFIFILISILILSYVTLPYTMEQMSEVLKDSSLSEYMEEHNINLSNISFVQKLFMVVPELIFLFIIIGAGAFFTFLFFGIGGAEGIYINYFAIVTGASLIDIVFPKILESVSLIFNVKLFSLISPLILFPGSDPKSLTTILISRFDVFSIWYTIALALGIAHFSKISIKKSMTISVIYFLFKVIILSAFSFLAMNIFRG